MSAQNVNPESECAIFEDDAEASRWVAHQMAQLIIETRPKDGAQQGHPKKSCVLGLATGSTPKAVYAALVNLYQEGNLDFSHVVTFNLDEYYPIDPGALQSYHRYMHHHLFQHVNIPRENIHLLQGGCPVDQISKHCQDYEAAIQEAGGIDFLLLGIGSKGHIGFNEAEPENMQDCYAAGRVRVPFSTFSTFSSTRTRLVTLAPTTRMLAAAEFFDRDHVPYRALSMGMATILGARRIMLLAYGEGKAEAVRAAVEGPPNNPNCPASYLQSHPNATIVVDAGAAEQLSSRRCPWVAQQQLLPNSEPCLHMTSMTSALHVKVKAVCWLSRRVCRPISRLTTDDYLSAGLADLLYDDGGGPGTGNVLRPEIVNDDVLKTLQAKIGLFQTNTQANQRSILIFSPHPDDDVIRMGGTLLYLCNNPENDVHVAYQTNGAIAVRDEDLIDLLCFARMVVDECWEGKGGEAVGNRVFEELEKKKLPENFGKPDSPLVLKYKAKVRENEARSAALACGVRGMKKIHFLDLPFYKTGIIDKDPLGPEDDKIMDAVFTKVDPDIVFAAGDLSDPHGTHRTCLQAVESAVERRERKPTVYLYRGAWQEWEVEEADVIVPLSSAQLDSKVKAICKHRSQKDPPPFPGADPREFWNRARSRNEGTAKDLAALGVGWWDGAEAFVKLKRS